jgi:hypothetical protein
MLVMLRRRRFLMDPKLRDRLRAGRGGRDGSWSLRPRFEGYCLRSRRGNCLYLDAGRGKLLLLCGLRSSGDRCYRELRDILLCLDEMSV